jgi:exodeoxyribonuclease V alpha subunit
MPSKYYFYETSVAQKIALLNSSQIIKKIEVEDQIKHFEEKNKIAFHEEQKNAIKNALNNGVCVITGGPGTGKTTIIKCIIEILKQNSQKFMLLAPTGRASKRLGDATGEEAKTIHRALEVASGELGSINRFVYNENNPFKTNCVIVDEVSMVDVGLMSHLCKALPRDCKLVLVGDKDQLPSVGAGNVLDDIIKSEIVSVSMLTKIFRQSDNSLIITNAHLINNGKMPIIDNKSADFFFDETEDLEEILDSIVNMVTKRLPAFTKLDPLQIQVLAPLRAGVCGIDNLNRRLQEALNPPAISKMEVVVGDTIFRTGDKVMQTSNNYGLVWTKYNGFVEEEGEGVFNGDIGTVELIDYQTNEMIVMFEDGRRCLYPRTELSQLSLAYAITIHKSQGSEFDVVVMPSIAGPSMILTRNLIYTAVTRAKKMVVIVGQQTNLKRMVRNNYTMKRYTLLKDLLLQSDKKIRELFE